MGAGDQIPVGEACRCPLRSAPLPTTPPAAAAAASPNDRTTRTRVFAVRPMEPRSNRRPRKPAHERRPVACDAGLRNPTFGPHAGASIFFDRGRHPVPRIHADDPIVIRRRAMKKKTLLSWSSGKDSAWALHLLRRDPKVEVLGLFTVMNRKHNRVSMHATRAALLERQADALGLPLQRIHLPDPCTGEQCDAIMREFVMESAAKGIECMAFGDLFLEEVRRYREDHLNGTGIEPVFPLWAMPTRELAEEMLSAGLDAYVSSVDLQKLPSRLAGRRWSRELISELPGDCDPCGENGEIHTVTVGGPMFPKAVPVTVGEIVERDGFAYADIIPVN